MSISDRQLIGATIGAAIICVFIYAAKSSQSPAAHVPQPATGYAASTTQDAAGVTPEPEAVADTAPPVMHHNYVLEDNGEYGYQRPVSDADAQAGTVQNTLVMMRYLGEKNGVFTASMPIPGGAARISCKLPCEFIKLQGIYAGEVVSTSILPAAGTIGEAVLDDAIDGDLQVYGKHSKKVSPTT